MTLDPNRLEFCATIFMRECIRHYIRLHPKADLEAMPVGPLCEYSARDQKALMAALAVAIEGSTGFTEQYREFLEQKIALAQSQQPHPTHT